MGADTAAGLSAALAGRSATLSFEELPAEIVELARQALIDWLAVTLGGCAEPGPEMLAGTLGPSGARGASSDGAATVIGRGERAAPRDAALINGTASHALDFDDVNMTVVCHVSAALLGAAIALGESIDAAGEDLIVAYVAGYETACRVGAAIGPEPYLRGLHPTGTVGAFGAAAACARLLGLGTEQTASALGIAASGASGLKVNFGSMTKPLHAGRANETGLLAATLASRGFTASGEAIEGRQGFAAVAGGSCDQAAALAEPPGGWHLRANLFKFHAACYFAHSAIEGVAALREEHGFRAESVGAIRLHIGDAERSACVIAAPRTSLEVKFSIAHLAAMALLDRETAAIGDHAARDGEVIALRERVELRAADPGAGATRVEVELRDGSVLEASRDLNQPAPELSRQRARLESKFTALAEPVLGAGAAAKLLARAAGVEGETVRSLTAAANP